MSELASITVTPLWPTNSAPGGLLLYEVRVERLGAGLLSVQPSSGSLPAGCTVTFVSGSLRFTGNSPRYQYFTMSVNSATPVALDRTAFTVTGTAQRESVTYTNVPSALLRLAPMPSLIVDFNRLNDGSVELRGLGDTGQEYQIEVASSLTNPDWSPVGTCTADGNGRFIFTHAEPSLPSPSARFYRAVMVGTGN